MTEEEPYVVSLAELSNSDVARVGGKNASLGEMIQHLREAGVRVPGGFATTSRVYRDFVEGNELAGKVADELQRYRNGRIKLGTAAKAVRRLFLQGEFDPGAAEAIKRAYSDLAIQSGVRAPAVAVRSSATAEDRPDASFAGQQETYLNVRGERELLDACRRCYASLFTDRAIAYRENHGYDHLQVALSVGVQRMVRADKGGAGVMFSIDTETGFPRAVLINAAWGLGETVVQGSVDPDEYRVFKPLLEDERLCPILERRLGAKENRLIYGSGGAKGTRTERTPEKARASFVLRDEEVLQLARWAVIIENHYGRPMDMEWAKDGESGDLYIVQARPETVQSRKTAGSLKRYSIHEKGRLLTKGLSVGEAVAVGEVCRLRGAEDIGKFRDGAILVTGMTDPDWVPIMKRAAAIVTDHGGRTSHAAIVSRELGLPAVVGAGDATRVLKNGSEITVSCAEGDEGFVYAGRAQVDEVELSLDEIPRTKTEVMVNLANPAAALRWWQLPTAGVGLARMEFIINNAIKVHPMALAHFKEVKEGKLRREIERITRGFEDKRDYFVHTLAEGIAMIAASQHPQPAIVRLSDFKTNEYAKLIGGAGFEPKEANPMLGWRGASRYYSEGYRDGFALECHAIKRVRETIGLDNVIVMVPFCRTVAEADLVLGALADNGLIRGESGLQIYVMAEIPANIVRAEAFAERFDGFSIGSNDLTQLVLGIDRDSDALASLFDERDEAVTSMIEDLIKRGRGAGRKVGLCGQAPSDHPEFASTLVELGIDSISVSPDSFIAVAGHVAEAERRARAQG